jgi:hypothetical protein
MRFGKLQRYRPCVGSGDWSLASHRGRPFRSQASPHESCGGQNGTGADFSASTVGFSVSIIPPMLHTHSFVHQRHIIKLANSSVVLTLQSHVQLEVQVIALC